MSSRMKNFLLRAAKTLAFSVAVCIFFGITTGGKVFAPRSIQVILRQSVYPAIIIMAMLPNVSLGMMDFSAGAVVTATSIIAGRLMNATGTGLPGLICFCIVIAVAFTSLTGFLNNKLKVPIIVVALGLTLVYEAIPSLLFPENSTVIINFSYAVLSQSPNIFIVFAVAFVVFYMLNSRTAYGHNIQALGGNSELATRAGLKVERIQQMSFCVSGIFLGIASAVYLTTNGQVDAPAAFASMPTVMDAFLGLFLGRFLAQYCNTAIGIVVAVITMTVLTNGMLQMGIDATYRDIVKSIILFLLLAFSANQPAFVRWRADVKRAAEANAAYQKKLGTQ